MRSTKNLVALLVVILLGAGCSAPAVKTEVTLPAKADGMVNAKNIAFVTFNGDKQRLFTTKLESYVANIKVSKQPYFTIVGRDQINRIIQEQRMVAESGHFDESQMVKLGRLAGVDTIISGAIEPNPYSENSYDKSEQECTKYKDHKCINYRYRHIRCTHQNADIQFALKAVSVESGTIIFSKNYSGKGRHEYCSNYGSPKSKSELVETATRVAVTSLRRDIAPYKVDFTIELLEIDRGIKSNNKATKHFKSAMEFSEEQRMDRACEEFRLSLAAYNGSPATLYNMGVCAEIEGNLERAERYYKQADAKSSKPIEPIGKALERMTERRVQKDKVSKQLIGRQ